MADLHFELVTPEKLVRSDDVHMVAVLQRRHERRMPSHHAELALDPRNNDHMDVVRPDEFLWRDKFEV